jgi:hypothetical protein
MPVADITIAQAVPAGVRERYPGKWITLREGEVVASADDLEALLAIERVGADVLYYVPPQGSHFY